MERKQNWQKFRSLLQPMPTKKTGLLLLAHEQKVLAGAVCAAKADLSTNLSPMIFQEKGKSFTDGDSLWSELSEKYNADGATLLDRGELLRALSEVSHSHSQNGLPESYYSQLRILRDQFGVDSGQKNSLAKHYGDKPVSDFWPATHFLLQIFQPLFADLLPERKLLLLGIVRGTELQTIVLEFVGSELRTFAEPDFSALDWQGQDLFHKNSLERFVAWIESRYMLPAYALFLSAAVWEECQKLQLHEGSRSAWKYLLRQRRQREQEPEICLHPETWPLKAALQWQGNHS